MQKRKEHKANYKSLNKINKLNLLLLIQRNSNKHLYIYFLLHRRIYQRKVPTYWIPKSLITQEIPLKKFRVGKEILTKNGADIAENIMHLI